MQLINKNSRNIKGLLAVATGSLLGAPVQAEVNNDWQFDTALMFYSETDRVSAAEGIISATKEFEDEHFLNLKLTLDSLTGASANGAVAQPTAQTFTRPSGRGSFEVKAGETPLDDTFRDTRVQLNAQWSQPLNNDYSASGGMHFSKEYDYLSLGLNGNISRYFNQKNTTVSLGFAYSNDTISPEGGIPKPYSAMLPAGDSGVGRTNRLGADDSKATVDGLFGLTQVINRRMIMQLNYSYSAVSGYQTDPFKVVSQVNSQGISQQQLYESRPDKRTKQSVFLQTKYHLDNSVLDTSYRYFWDDWGVTSHTIDSRYRLPLFTGYLEPHVRFYQQSAADFYQPFILQSNAIPSYISADYRIGELEGVTLGLKYGMPMKNGNELAFRFEIYKQTPKSIGTEQPGVLAALDLHEGVNAAMLQLSYSF